MKISKAKFYVGVHLAGVVRTHFTGVEEWFKGAEAVPNMGVVVRTERRLEDKNETITEAALVPFANVAYGIIDESDSKPKAVKAKGA